MSIDLENDPLVRFLDTIMPPQAFTEYLERALANSSALDEALAGLDEAQAARREQQAGLFPTLDLSFGSRVSFARDFSNDTDNVLERAQSRGRTDATFVLQQRILDFGAQSIRIAAASSRLRAASVEIDRQSELIVGNAIATWYEVYTFRALITLGDAYLTNQQELRAAIEERIADGVSARGDLATVDSTIAAHRARMTRYRRQLANAEARFVEIFEIAPPSDIGRGPMMAPQFVSTDAVLLATRRSATVARAEAEARAALQDARAARADTLPQINAQIEGGRFGIFENENDYDIRGSLTLTHRFFGGGDARADQAEARANARAARAETVREEVRRQATIAWSDVQSLERQLDALQSAYLSSRQSRDVIIERFRFVRGTLIDVLNAEDNFFVTAALYVQTVTELDVARYILILRTGDLLNTLGLSRSSQSSYRLRAEQLPAESQ
ncbi:MAG: TolC family protein [Cyanobacteria bacterium J06638_22]